MAYELASAYGVRAIRVHVDFFSKRTNKNPEKGRGLGLVTLKICSINKKALAGAKVTYDSSAYMKAPIVQICAQLGTPPLKL